MIKLYNGDCYDVLKYIPDKSIDLVIIDPPYQFTATAKKVNHGVGDTALKAAENKAKERKRIADKFAEEEFSFKCLSKEEIKKQKDIYEKMHVSGTRKKIATDIENIGHGFTNEVLDILCEKMKAINIYVWCSKKQLLQLLNYFDAKGCNYEVLTWHKTNCNPAANNMYLCDTEYVVFARESGVRVYGTVYTKHKYYVSAANIEDKKKYLHPTIKPVNIIKNFIINSSLEGDTVLDCFMGSGTTGVACKVLNRNFIGIEIDYKYFKIAGNRINEVQEQTSFDFDMQI